MNRTDIYEKGKITKSTSTETIALNIYYDAFSIEKVRFQVIDYVNKDSIESYVDFEDIAILANDIKNGKLLEEIKNVPKTISIGGSKTSKKYDGAPESRVMTFELNENVVIVKMTSGKGILSDTSLILPDGEPSKELSVSIPIDKFRSMIIYTYDCVRGYLPQMISKIVADLNNDRANFLASNKE